jgi:hypothetical protein
MGGIIDMKEINYQGVVEHNNLICPHCAGKGIMLRLYDNGRNVNCMKCGKHFPFANLRLSIEKTSSQRLPMRMFQSTFDYTQGVKREIENRKQDAKNIYRKKLVPLDIGPGPVNCKNDKPKLSFLEFKLICFVRMYRQLKNAYGKCPKLCDKYWAVRDNSGNAERMAFYLNAMQRNGVNINLIR